MQCVSKFGNTLFYFTEVFMKKKLLFAAGASLFAALVPLTACNFWGGINKKPSGKHEHTFSETWQYDETEHWHESTCGHDVTDGKNQHDFDNRNCIECGYLLPPEEKELTIDKLHFIWNTELYGYTVSANKEKIHSLKKIEIPASVNRYPVKGIDDLAFAKCNELTTVTIPDSVTDIGDAAFAYCKNLKSITVPDSVTKFGEAVFGYCESLTNVTIPNNLKTISYGMFAYCYRLTSIKIPYGVTSIQGGAFGFCKNLTNITIPDSVTEIESGVFMGCSGLTSIALPDSVTYIGNDAFFECSRLSNIMIPHGVSSIESDTFTNCNELISISIPVSVTNIKYAFSSCNNLSEIHFNGTIAQWNAIEKANEWDRDIRTYTVYCTDGQINK